MMQGGLLGQCGRACWLMLLLAVAAPGETSRRDVTCRLQALRLQPGYLRDFSVRPDAIAKGEKVILSWYVPSEGNVLIERSDSKNTGLVSLGRFQPHGSLEVWPEASTIFVFSYGDPQALCVKSIWVTVH
jgi:hypothetical protein